MLRRLLHGLYYTDAWGHSCLNGLVQVEKERLEAV